jgi:hypothetical protein
MAIMDRLDPELRAVVEQIPVLDLTDLAAARRSFAELYAQINTGERNPRVTSSDHTAPGRDGSPDVMVRVFRPVTASGPLPCLYWTQGGGYVLTAPDMDDQFCEEIVEPALGELDGRRYEASAPLGPPGSSRSASTFSSHPDRSPWGVRESVEEHQVSPRSAGLPVDLANNPLTNDLEASPRDPGTGL